MDGAVEFVKHRWTRWHTLFAIILIAGLSFLHGKTHVELKRSRAGPCALQFKRYVPSEWEEYWLVNKKQIAPKICEVLKANDSASGVWIDSLAEAWNLDHPIDERVQQTFADASHVFSTYEYVDTCSGKQVNVPVEPLVGLLRHPWCPFPSFAPATPRPLPCAAPLSNRHKVLGTCMLTEGVAATALCTSG